MLLWNHILLCFLLETVLSLRNFAESLWQLHLDRNKPILFFLENDKSSDFAQTHFEGHFLQN